MGDNHVKKAEIAKKYELLSSEDKEDFISFLAALTANQFGQGQGPNSQASA